MEEEYYSIEDRNAWSSIFQRLHHAARTQAGSQSDGKKPENVTRNRYRDVIPIDAHRVKLNDEQNDYINASYVEVSDVKRKYILSQGPLQHTCHHFWQMIWEQKTAGIVMLNKCIERGSNKCFQYWPHSLQRPILEAGAYKIELVSIDDMSSYRMSTLQLENMESEESEPRTILHFHYTRWPDFGVPRTPDDFLEFLQSVRKTGVLNEDVGPCVVHCSAGIGRSGTFCLIDVCLKKIEITSDLSLQLQPILLDMRKQRLGLVQTADQLRFCYIAVLQASIPDDSEEEEVQESDSEEDEEEEKGVSVGQDVHNGYKESSGSVGANIYKDHHFDDVPPPIPPRYPDMLVNHSPSPPPPPPPSMPPPGPPEYGNDQDDDSEDEDEDEANEENQSEDILVRYEKNESFEGSKETDTAPWYLNGDSNVEQSEGEGVSNTNNEEPPSPPPRVQSVYREKESPSHADHFLGVGRGGEDEAPPLPPPTHQAPVPPVNQSEETLLHPQAPPHHLATFNEEKALISELEELEKIVSHQSPVSQQQQQQQSTVKETTIGSTVPLIEPTTTTATTKTTTTTGIVEENQEENEAALKAKELRRREREERQRRLNEKVSAMKDKIGKENTQEWSTSWLVVGVVAIASYCVYYYLS